MEGKDRWEQKGRIFFSLFIFFTLLSIASLLPFCLHSLPTIYHPTLVHRQHRILCSLWTSNTRLARPILTEDTSGMVRSAIDDNKGTAPPKPVRKIWTMGSIPATDKDFLVWCENQAQSRGTRSRNYGTLDAMKLYVQHLNIESKMLYERQLKERKDQPHLTEPVVDAVPTPEPSGTKAPDDTDGTTRTFSPPIPRTFSLPTPKTFQTPNPQNIQLPLS